jgi:hypothetical protein
MKNTPIKSRTFPKVECVVKKASKKPMILKDRMTTPVRKSDVITPVKK